MWVTYGVTVEIIPPQALPHGLAVLFHLLIFIRVAIRLLEDLLISAALETDSMLCRSEKKYLQPFEYFSPYLYRGRSLVCNALRSYSTSKPPRRANNKNHPLPSLQVKHRYSKHHDAGATTPSLFRESRRAEYECE